MRNRHIVRAIAVGVAVGDQSILSDRFRAHSRDQFRTEVLLERWSIDTVKIPENRPEGELTVIQTLRFPPKYFGSYPKFSPQQIISAKAQIGSAVQAVV